MKITFLGTAAAEGFPAVFCNCEYCNQARRLGGKNIRTRSQSLINDDMLIDFPADTYSHLLQNGIQGDAVKYLLITHGHSDHLCTHDLKMRHGCFAHHMNVPTMQILCSPATADLIGTIPPGISVTTLAPYQTVELGPYRVTPLPARHMLESEAYIYIIQGDKTLLYAHDTGYFYQDVFDYLEKNRVAFDMVSLDCTNMDIPISDSGTHMGFPNIERLLDRLSSMGAVRASTVKYINHFSHNGNPLQSVLEERAGQYGCSVAYDGCPVVF